MVFWVFYGRVRVEVAGIEFSIGKGGMWQVPRGESQASILKLLTKDIGVNVPIPQVTFTASQTKAENQPASFSLRDVI